MIQQRMISCVEAGVSVKSCFSTGKRKNLCCVLALFVFLKMLLLHLQLLLSDCQRFQKIMSATSRKDTRCVQMRDQVDYTPLEHFFENKYLSYLNTLHITFFLLRFSAVSFLVFHRFNLCGLLAALLVALFSPHQFVQYFQQLCVPANSQWSYCTLFAFTSKKKKSCRQTVGPGTLLKQPAKLQLHHSSTRDSCYLRAWSTLCDCV